MQIEEGLTMSDEEAQAMKTLGEMLERAPLSSDEKIQHIYLFTHRRTIAKLLWMDHIYREIVNVPGVIAEFGVHFGRNLALFESLRGVHEPYNFSRKILGFDTFSGFFSISDKDPNANLGGLSVPENYKNFLQQVLTAQSGLNPHANRNHIELYEGNAPDKLRDYLDAHPETIFAMIHLDIGLYKPTIECLELASDHLVGGSIICFDQLNDPNWPGDTLAMKHFEGLSQKKFVRLPFSGNATYVKILAD